VYSSLTKIDIVAERDGVRHFVQTDHRGTEEVDAELEISTLFALARTIGPRRMIEEGAAPTVVRYVALGGLHPAIARVLAATGAEAEVEGKQVALDGVARVPAADLADQAFAALARRVADREQLALDEGGLEALEELTAGAPSVQDDEITYWTTVAELAAVTGEVLRTRFGGRWVDDPRCLADIPFVFRIDGGERLLNAVGKAVKFLDAGKRESPRQLIVMADDASVPHGPLLFTLKPARWPGAAETVWEPLVPDLEKTGADIPIIVYGEDKPSSFAIYVREGREDDLADLRRRALENLTQVEVAIEDFELDGVSFIVVQGSYYAGEKILDVAFMRQLHARLRTKILAAAMPRKNELLVTNAVVQPRTMLAFLAIVQGTHDNPDGGPPISPTTFLVQDGKVVGVAAPHDEAQAPEPKKGFFRRLFG
jgi:hypothetical protein